MKDPSKPSNGHLLLAILLLIAAMAAVFGQTCGYEFLVWDDDKHVTDNPHLNPVTWHSVGQFYREPYWGLYIPLSYTFFAAEASIARLPPGGDVASLPNPLVFHTGSLVLHVACVLLVFVILRRLFRHNGAACAGALLFGLHPVQVESVAWISETRGLLCAMFSLLAIWLYLDHAAGEEARKSARTPYIMATACFVLAVLCKPAAVAVPLIVAALDVGRLRRPVRRVLWDLSLWLVIAAGCVVLTKLQQPSRQLPFVAPLWARPMLAGDALAFYLIKLIAPVQLGPDYGRTPAWVMGQWSFYVAWILPAAVLIGLTCLRHRRLWLTAAAISIAWVLPVLGLVPFVFQRISTVADRYLYLALLGPALLLGWLLTHRSNRLTIGLTWAVLCLLGVLSFLQTTHWRSNDTLLTHALRINPRSVIAGHNRGYLLAKEEKHVEAIERFRNALIEHPDHPELHLSLASSLVALGRIDEALKAMQDAVKRLPREPLLHCKFGNVLRRKDADDRAEEHYRRALELDPGCVRAELDLATLLLDGGQLEAAIEHYRQALHLTPNLAPAHVNLGAALKALGRLDEARYHYRKALQLRPKLPSAHYNLAILLATEGSIDRAIEHYRTALKFDPEHARARVNLGTALFEKGETPEAIEHYRAALRIEPDLVPARVNLGRALAAEGRSEEAAAEFRAALQLVPADSKQARQIREFLEPYEWRSLFDGKQLGQWKVADRFDFLNHGQVEVKDGRLLVGRGRPGTAIRFTGKFPTLDYELTMEAMRVEGDDFFCALTFPIGNSPCTLIVGGWNGPVVGLSNVDGEPAMENETVTYMEFKNKRWYKIRLRVTKAKVEAWIDKQKVVDLATKDRKFTISFEEETVLPLGVATWKTTGAMRNIRVRPIQAKETTLLRTVED